MARLRLSRRFRIGLLFGGVSVGVLLTATPRAGQQGPTAAVRTMAVPTVAVPRLPPVAPQGSAPRPLRVLPVARVASFVDAARERLPYLPGQVLVRFKDGVNRIGQQRALTAASSRSDVNGLQWIGNVALLKDGAQPDSRALARLLSQQPEVAYAEPNYLRQPLLTPNDPSFGSRQWNLSSINMPRAWDISSGGSDQVIVAVIDSGVTSVPAQNVTVRTWDGNDIVTHVMPIGPSPDFDLSRIVLARDFSWDETAPDSSVVDLEGHGTHVAGTIGEGTNNSTMLAGIAYKAKIMPLKVCLGFWDLQFAWSDAGLPGVPDFDAGCPDSSIIAAIRFAADNGARVINISIGGGPPNAAVRDALAYAVGRGVFVAMANGNAYEDGNPTTYPAAFAIDIDGAMSVAATNRLNNRAYYSNTGSYTEIAAPGGDDNEGNLIWQATLCASDSDPSFVFLPRFDRYCETPEEGTSMASPHVAGVAALLVSRGITNPATIEGMLKKTALDLGSPGRDVEFGYGLIQPFAALFGRGGAR